MHYLTILLKISVDLLVRINLGFTCLYQLSDEIFGLRKNTTRSRSRNMSFIAMGNLIGVGIIPDGVIPHGGNPHGRFPNGGKHIIIICNKVFISVLFVSMCCLSLYMSCPSWFTEMRIPATSRCTNHKNANIKCNKTCKMPND